MVDLADRAAAPRATVAPTVIAKYKAKIVKLMYAARASPDAESTAALSCSSEIATSNPPYVPCPKIHGQA